MFREDSSTATDRARGTRPPGSLQAGAGELRPSPAAASGWAMKTAAFSGWGQRASVLRRGSG